MNKLFIALTLVLALAACGTTIRPPANPGIGPLGLLEVTFSGLGANLSVSAQSLTSSLRPQAMSDIGDGIQLKLVSRDSFDVGTRGADGQRYLSATFKVRNANTIGTAYPLERQNLSFIAVNAGAALAQTAVSRLTRFDGSPANPLLAQGIQPTHGMEFRELRARVAAGLEDFQALTENEIAPLAASLASSGVNTVFPYGFVARCIQNCTAGTRALKANPMGGQFDGLVTFAVRLPLQATATNDPFSFSLLFEVVDDDTARITKSAEENSSAAARARAAALTNSSLTSGHSVCALRTAGVDPLAPLAVLHGAGLEAAGSLDACWNGNGVALTSLGGFDAAQFAGVQPDGKIIAVGSHNPPGTGDLNIGLARYNPDGSLDSGFGNAGTLTQAIGVIPQNATLQPDGKIVVLGTSTTTSDFRLVRFNHDGSLDSSFGSAGPSGTDFNAFLNTPRALTLQSDGKIVVVGSSQKTPADKSDMAIARFNPDGGLDGSFGNAGTVLTDINARFDTANAVIVQSDGKLVVAGNSSLAGNSLTSVVLARYNQDGSPDASFGNAGVVSLLPSFGAANAMAVQPDGKLLVAGKAGNADFAVWRFRADGSLDAGFGTAGVVVTNIPDGNTISNDTVASILLQPDGKILVGGDSSQITNNLALVRYNPDGSLDAGFGVGGKVVTSLGSRRFLVGNITAQPDGRVLLSGFHVDDSTGRFALLRYWP